VLGATEPARTSTKPLAVFASAGSLSIYDIAADSVKGVATSPPKGAVRPRFRTPRLVSFVRLREQPDAGHTFGQDSLYELDLETGKSTELLRLPNSLHGYAWSPDGTLLAYQLRAESATEDLPVSLCLFDSHSGATRFLRPLAPWAGRDTNQRDEVSVAWSPSANDILVVDTIEQPSVYVVGVDGRAVAPPRDGSFARWLSDDRVLVWDDPQSTIEPGSWLTFSTSTGAIEPFALPPDAHRPALSPDGQMIAFDDGNGAAPSVYVFDVQSGTSRRLARGYVAPVWIGPDLIAATAVGPCPPDNFCVVPWSTLGRTVGIDVRTGERTQLSLPTTLPEIFIYGVIDTSLDIRAP
jgi:hypothetical protein